MHIKEQEKRWTKVYTFSGFLTYMDGMYVKPTWVDFFTKMQNYFKIVEKQKL